MCILYVVYCDPALSLLSLQDERLADRLDEARSELDVMSAEITSLTAQLKEREEEVRAKEDQLEEMKNMNTALENQLTEYMDALELQNQVKTSLLRTQE